MAHVHVLARPENLHLLEIFFRTKIQQSKVGDLLPVADLPILLYCFFRNELARAEFSWKGFMGRSLTRSSTGQTYLDDISSLADLNFLQLRLTSPLLYSPQLWIRNRQLYHDSWRRAAVYEDTPERR